jgi:RNA polymerase II subunit A C-terminal domain phosphatase SSU72
MLHQHNAEFDSVSYSEIYEDLVRKNRQHYQQKGILGMLQRNMGIKPGPQRWQDHRQADR